MAQRSPADAQEPRRPQQGIPPSSSEAVGPATPPGQLLAAYLHRSNGRGLSSLPTALARAPAGQPAPEPDVLLVAKKKWDRVS